MPQQISQAEFDVMSVLWEESPLGAAEIAARLEAKTGWSVKTVKTLLSRLVEKNALSHEPDGRRFLYRPRLSKRAYEKSETRSFAERLFGGRAAPLVAYLADGRGLSTEDIEELDALLEELKRERD